jgi:hypothetical protein
MWVLFPIIKHRWTPPELMKDRVGTGCLLFTKKFGERGLGFVLSPQIHLLEVSLIMHRWAPLALILHRMGTAAFFGN